VSSVLFVSSCGKGPTSVKSKWTAKAPVGRIRWRTTEKLKINCLWMLLYIHDNRNPNRVWFDDVVIATEYIGPLVER